MFRKWITVVLCLMLSVMLPVAALADTQHTFSVVPGEALGSQQAVTDLLDVLALRVTEGENSGALSVLLNDQQIVTLGLKADETGLYAGSELLGDDVFYVTWEDGFACLSELLAATLAESGVDEAMLQELDAGLAEVKTGILAAVQKVPEQPAAPALMEENLKTVEAMFPNDPAMVEYIKGLYDTMTIEEGAFTAEDRDAADQKYRLVMDEADLTGVCETQYMKNILRETIAMEMPEASQDEVDSALESTLAEMKTFCEEIDFEMIVEMYTLDAGSTLVGLDMIINMNAEAAGQGTAQMAGLYKRLTGETGVSHKADAAMAAEGEKMEFVFELQQGVDGASEGLLGMLAGGEEVVVLFTAEGKPEERLKRSFELYLRSGATAILEPSAGARPVLGVRMVTEPAPAETLDALENARGETSVNVLGLSEVQLKELTNQISLNATQILYTALGQLPTSVLQLLMGSGIAGQ